MTELLSLPRARIPRWGRRVPVRADHLNQMVDAQNKLVEGVQPPRTVRRRIVHGVTAQFRIVENGIHDQHILARMWDAKTETEGADVVPILRPALLQNPYRLEGYQRRGITYFHRRIVDLPESDPQERIATRVTTPDLPIGSELQIVVPRYFLGDIIYATRGIVGELDILFSEPGPDPDPVPDGIEWVDDNRDARAWASIHVFQ